jgi:hypothetical protein
MRALIWKEWRENLKWAGLPALLMLLPLVLLGGPGEPVPGIAGALIFWLIAAASGAALGFVQVFFESRGDQRALLMHRPISPSRIFLGKVIAGVGTYLLAVGLPFACVQGWMAVPGHMPAPYHWGTGLPWLADILAGVVYYFAGMLAAQREARWYGSRGLGLAAAFFCTFLVWTLPEFWQALMAIVLIGTWVGVAAWGGFVSGGAYSPQPPIARAALALTLLTGLLVVSFVGKLAIGKWYHSGSISYGHWLDRQGRVLVVPSKEGVGPIEPLTDLEGRAPPDLQGKRVDRNVLEELEAPLASMDWPIHRSYRNPAPFYVRYFNDSTPGNEVWYYAAHQGRLLGYDAELKQFLGSFGPNGFVPAGEQPGERFQEELQYPTRFWKTLPPTYLVFPGGVYDVDFSRRTIRALFTPAEGETVVWARRWKDRREKQSLTIVSTDRSIHLLTEGGARAVSVPRAYDREKYGGLSVGRLEGPQRYVLWYQPSRWLEPDERRTMPSYLLEYDTAGKEVARRAVPPPPLVEPSYAEALFGLATPMTEFAALVGTTKYLFASAGSTRGSRVWVLLEFLDEWTGQFIPGGGRLASTRSGLLPAFAALILLSGALCAVACVLLARRYAFSRARRIGWLVCGLLFGPAGLLLMLTIQDWPARIACPKCGKPRVVTRDTCEHCGAAHAPPAADGTEIFEEAPTLAQAALVER